MLDAMFGTPDKPFVLAETGLTLKKIQLAAGPVWSDQAGKQRGLYRQHCVHCHGTTGDGAGPTAAILNPYPRDYRQGKFKFKSTERAGRADRRRSGADHSRRRARHGHALVRSAARPDEVDSLVEYVKYLSMRGQTEIKLDQRHRRIGRRRQAGSRLERDLLVDEILSRSLEKLGQRPTSKIIGPPEASSSDERAG